MSLDVIDIVQDVSSLYVREPRRHFIHQASKRGDWPP